MPKRVLDGEGFWGSRKLRRCPVWIRREYPYLYPLADCNGNFELDIPVILGKLKANRPDLSIRKLELIFDTFKKEGLAFVWAAARRQYVHWTGSERRGRLPQPSHRSNKYERKLAPPYPQEEYAAYLQQFGELVDVAASTSLATASARATVRAKERAKEKPSQDLFLAFWKSYPRKVGKPAAQRTWKNALLNLEYLEKKSNSPGDREPLIPKIMAGLERWKETEQWQEEKFIPHPATFLNQRRWEDEPPDTNKGLSTAELGTGPVPSRTSHCAYCGAETPLGFLKCLKCIKKKAPANP